MKVLGVINGLGTGGAEKLILDAAPLLRDKIDIHFLFLEEKNYPFEKKFKEIFKGTYFFSKWKSVYNPLHIITLSKKLKNYEVVHVHLFPAFFWVVIAKLITFSKIKIFVTEHNTTNHRMDNQFLSFFDKKLYRLFYKTICISAEIQQIMMNYTCLDEVKFPVIRNGINLESITNAVSLNRSKIEGLLDSDVMILQVSGFRKQKNQHTLIKSLQYLPENHKVFLAGTGDTLQDCKQLTKRLNLTNRVIFLGVRTDIPALLKTADVVVLSSHYEGLSLSSIEGMASGRPFIASDVPGLRSVVQGAGLLFEDGNEKELANHITKLMNDAAYYHQIATACQERAREYDINKMVDAQVKLYQELH
jgi:glycosyltransferase involved in cell wall biosynthesis